MVYCRICGKKMKDDSNFCDGCGANTEGESDKKVESRKVKKSLNVNPKKTAWASAVLNLLFFGFGYVYNGKRKSLGVFLIIFWAIDLFDALRSSSWHYLHMVILGSILAYDSYNEAKQINIDTNRPCMTRKDSLCECGNKLTKEDDFCPECGKKVK